ncbi:MAG: tRNA pseudouridine(55) synthase TruB [Candidatus Magasanikbacteria bacterium]|uniref:tRNA pseudouridine synthase B n=1 Tax=Candidatus Magasanikbacteria bacterium CG10_big_fil_rev_8_21_14_0_10_38_6 TaxID=1974647 RepID=A0A2M6P0W3_9BACT|nr:tRNA pseudouridine(55) synthase TruB [Candidatus Magasanikbacteria bacterium]PIR77341.1 MAG: tRNA pseudouridine(55) synthase TruB [Candidatus Magasanikbacteria bacterium CG10_big_fil_rev_8_21_14_0_10_38_6]
MNTGFLLINKPEEWTSHDVVGYLRGVTHIKKIGHAGTLDPFATGLLIVGVGRAATKRLDEFKNLDKVYTTTITLGKTTDTFDKTGTTTTEFHEKNTPPSEKKIREIITSFIGTIQQLPPMYSAKKVNGKKLYELARKGITIERQPNTITIHDITIISYTYPTLTIRVTCSTGTYIRTLAHDIGQKLETGAYCETLHRDAIGPYTSINKPTPKELTTENWQSYLLDIPSENK